MKVGGEMTRNELMEIINNGALHFDISPIEATSIKDLNIDIIRDYFINYNTFDLYEEEKEAIERILINADILKEKEGKAVCSVGGILMFGKNHEKYLPQNGVSFAHFNGNDITDELIDKKVILGRIQDIAEQLLVVLKNNMVTSSKINGLLRVEKDEYPILVLREAIINSLVHRNYTYFVCLNRVGQLTHHLIRTQRNMYPL